MHGLAERRWRAVYDAKRRRHPIIAYLSHYPPILLGLAASLLAGLATSIGAIPVFLARRVPEKLYDGLLGFAAGVMLAATFFSLILPAIETGGGGVKGVLITAVGILAGGIFLDVIDKVSPHQHFIKGPEGGGATSSLNRIWLFIIAITIHNFPEGLAVGVGVGSGDLANGISLAIGIALQNIPEGLAVALALVSERYKAAYVFWVTLATGLVEPVGAMVGLVGIRLAGSILPYGLAFAAGAMLFVISDEIIPETHERGNERVATYLILIGFILMMFLDTTLG